jgi:hypothetical protein
VAPVVGNRQRHDHEVGDANPDLLIAPGAQVRLARLKWVDERDLEVVVVR